jgi:nucleotidyltransferase/DNA polymerase involved in DNA repair
MIIAHIDMDCFFAAVEEKYNPSLRNKPLVIGSLPTQKRGVVCTANYIARKYGCHSAQPTSMAYKCCPHATFMNPNMPLYKEESEMIMQILQTITSNMVQVSVDEAYLDITELCANAAPRAIAKYIKNEVYNMTGLTCSVGIARSKYVAKIASDFQKPAGITIVDNMKEFLAPLKIGKIPGIGKVSQKRFHTAGIYTIGDLARVDTQNIPSGIWSLKHQQIARGLDTTPLSFETREAKSVSNERTFEEDVSMHICEETLAGLASKLTDRLSNNWFKTVSIKIRYGDFTTITRDHSFKVAVKGIANIEKAVAQLLSAVPNRPIRLCGVKVSNFSTSPQMILTDMI